MKLPGRAASSWDLSFSLCEMGRSDWRFRCSSEHQGQAILFSLGKEGWDGDSGLSGDGKGPLGQEAESEGALG